MQRDGRMGQAWPQQARTARRLLPWVVGFLLFAVVGVAPRRASADPASEAAARALEKKAIDDDFLNLDYAAAIKRLQSALSRCAGDHCGAPLRAAILRDLGAMQIMAGNEGDGRASFAQALGLDAALDLDPSYKNPQLEGIWNDVKKKGSAPPSPATPTPPNPAPAVGAIGGDFNHAAFPEAPVRTPLPIFAEYAGGESLARVIVKYKATGMGDWKQLDLKKSGDGWAGLIPCKDVTTGALQYYLQGFNAANDPVATSGSRNKAFSVAIKAQISGDPPSLPGQPPPKQCGELAGAECPPDFPGCNSKKAAGEDCDKNADCKSGACTGGKCLDKKGAGEDCSSDDECASSSCKDGTCAGGASSGSDCQADGTCDVPKIWIGVSFGVDLNIVPGANNVCALKGLGDATPQPGDGTGPYTSGNPYTCLDSNNNPFPGTSSASAGNPGGFALNNAIQVGHSDQVQGGLSPGPVSVQISADYALTMNMLVGLRVGYEALTIPTGSAFAPVRAEARYTYLFGDGLKGAIAPLVLVGAGIGEFDSHVGVQVYLNNSSQNPYSQNAWLTAGPAFVTAGGGLRVGMGRKLAATIAMKFQGAFGGTAGFLPGLAPELGVQYGF